MDSRLKKIVHIKEIMNDYRKMISQELTQNNQVSFGSIYSTQLHSASAKDC